MIHSHGTLLFGLMFVSVAGFVGSLVTIPWILTKIPPDYFSCENRRKHLLDNYPPVIRSILLLIKNILGVVFIISGIMMLFLPGQGVITIVLGILLTDFPYKYKIERWIISRPAILKYINRLRVKSKQRPLEV